MILLHLAAKAAQAHREDGRCFTIGALAVRADGAIVQACNGASTRPAPDAHAEARVLRKAGRGAVVYVARVTRQGHWALARPCPRCMARLRAHGVRTVYYTIGNNEWGKVRP